MYEHIRAHLAEKLAAAEQAVEQAVIVRDQVEASLSQQQVVLGDLQRAVDAAQGALNARQAELAAAQAVVDQRMAEANSAQAERDAAQQAFDANGGDEPPPVDDPEQLRQWRILRDILRAALDAAQAVLNEADARLQQAIPPRDAAAAAVQSAVANLNQARGRVDAQNAAIAATRQQLTAAEAAIVTAQAAVAAVHAEVAGFDEREATLTAEPLDRTALERAADREEADLQAGWHRRRELFEQRVQSRQDRVDTLAEHDATVDELAVVRSRIAASTRAATIPALVGVVQGIDAVVADNATQRPRPPHERSDDLVGRHSQLAELSATLQTVLGQATATRDSAAHSLDQARNELAAHEQESP